MSCWQEERYIITEALVRDGKRVGFAGSDPIPDADADASEGRLPITLYEVTTGNRLRKLEGPPTEYPLPVGIQGRGPGTRHINKFEVCGDYVIGHSLGFRYVWDMETGRLLADLMRPFGLNFRANNQPGSSYLDIDEKGILHIILPDGSLLYPDPEQVKTPLTTSPPPNTAEKEEPTPARRGRILAMMALIMAIAVVCEVGRRVKSWQPKASLQ